MKTEEINQKVVFYTTPEKVYNAIMNSELHGKFTGSPAEIGEKPGDAYSAYDGYITGEILQLEPFHRIIKTWIAHEDGWPENHISVVNFEFNPIASGTEMIFIQTGVPAEKKESITQGWIDFYWEPMQDMFLEKGINI